MNITKEEYNKLKQSDRIELNTNLLLLDNRYNISYLLWMMLLMFNVISFGFISLMILLLYMNGTNLYYLQVLNVHFFKGFGLVVLILLTVDIISSIYFKNKSIKELKERFKI